MSLNNAVKISDDNICIYRINDKCIDCGMCTKACIEKEGLNFKEKTELCVNCGQCIQACPMGALVPKNDYSKFLDAKNSNKVCIAYTSPSVRVAIGEAFGLDYGTFEQNKLVGLLRKLGFDYVFDTTLAADLTIMEEANEFVERFKQNKNLPMFTSCCPAWIKYAEQSYPNLLDNISTCKSPIGMMGPIVKEYFCKNNNIENSFTVAITPCTAKKFEISRNEIDGTDLVLTISEIISKIKELDIKYEDIEESDYDSFLPAGSGAGMIFGNTGGVMEAAIRTVYNILTSKNLDKLELNEVRGLKGVKECTLNINGNEINIAVVNGIINSKQIFEQIKNGNNKYHYIEIMNCTGGCIGGGGMPKINILKTEEILNKRINSLYKKDNTSDIRYSHEHPVIKKIYDEFLIHPLSDKSKKYLHTKYTKRI